MLNLKWIRELSDAQQLMLSMFGVDLFRVRHPDEVAEMDDHEMMDAILTLPTHFTSTITGTLGCALTLKESLTTAEQPFIDTGDPAIQATINANGSITGVTVTSSQQKALSAGAVTADLTSLLSVRGATVSFSGLKVKYALLRNPSTNANSITGTFGAANPAVTFGTGWKLVLQPGDIYVVKLANSETVSGTAKNWDLTGTGSQALDIMMGAG